MHICIYISYKGYKGYISYKGYKGYIPYKKYKDIKDGAHIDPNFLYIYHECRIVWG